MAVTRNSGPLVVTGGMGQSGDSNATPGPSAFTHGTSILDPRFGSGGGGDSLTPNWYESSSILALDYAPSTLSATNLAAAQVPTAGTALTLAGASTGITVLAAPYSPGPGMTFPAGARMIDGNPALINLGGQTYGMGQYDPRTMGGRVVRVTSAGADTGTVAITAMDVYGQIVHETITMAGAGVVAGKKAIKALISAVPAAPLSGSNISIGTGDVYGFPLAVWEFPLVKIYWAGALISATTGFLAAVATTPTAITGDVRGTYATQSASNNANLLQVFVSPAPWQLAQAGMFGATQF